MGAQCDRRVVTHIYNPRHNTAEFKKRDTYLCFYLHENDSMLRKSVEPVCSEASSKTVNRALRRALEIHLEHEPGVDEEEEDHDHKHDPDLRIHRHG